MNPRRSRRRPSVFCITHSVPDSTPSPAPVRARTPWWFRLIRALLNLSLLALLGLQAFALVVLATAQHLQLPAFAQHALEARLQEQGLSVRFSSLEVSPTGALLLNDPKVFLAGTTDPIIEAEYFSVNPDWFALLWSHRLSFSDLRFGNTTFYCPPENSPTGTREPFISGFGGSLASQGNHWWRLDFLRGIFLNVQLDAQGAFALPENLQKLTAPATAPTPGPSAPSLAVQYRRWSREMLDLQPRFAAVDHPYIRVDIAGESSGLNKLRISASADGARPPVPGLDLARSSIRLEASWDGRVLRALSPALAWAQSMHYAQLETAGVKREVASSGPLWARLQLGDGPDGIFSDRPLHADLYALTARLDDFPLDSLAVSADLRSWTTLPFFAAALLGPDSLEVSGRADFASREGGVAWNGGAFVAHTRARLTTLLAASREQLPARFASLKLDAPLTLTASATFTPARELQSADLALRTDGVHFERIDLDSVLARAHFSHDDAGGLILDVRHAELNSHSWQVIGSYFQNLRTDDFRVLVHGDLEPRVLDPYLAQWWAIVWDYIKPGGQWPQADVSYTGNWQQLEAKNSLFVFAQIANARVRGIRMDDISVRVEQRPEILAVYDLIGHAFGGGQMQGAMLWTMKPPYQHVFEERFIFDSTLPLAAVAAIGGPEAAAVIHPLESPMPPAIHFDQRTGGLASPQPHVTSTKIHAEFSAPFHAYHVPLDNASVDATAYAGFTDIPRFDFGLAGGRAQANATITSSDAEPDELRFSLLLQNARHTDFLAALGQFSTSDAAPTPAPTVSGPASSTPTNKKSGSMLGDLAHPGQLDVSLGGRLLFGLPDSFIAEGRARVRDAQLGDLQLLGGLSRVLADTKLPLGSFALNDATSDVQIAHQYLRLPNLVVTGPSARVLAAGTYHFDGNDLDFNALIFPIAEWDSFLLKQIASIFNPFSNTITLKLHGKIEHSTWDINMNPLRIFEGHTIEGPAIPGFPAKANGAPDLAPLPPAPLLPDLPVSEKH